jgi:hypothetical protein
MAPPLGIGGLVESTLLAFCIGTQIRGLGP